MHLENNTVGTTANCEFSTPHCKDMQAWDLYKQLKKGNYAKRM